MANFAPAPVFFGSDNLIRSVLVVVDPRDFVTGGRVPVPLEVRLKDVAAKPIAAEPIAVYSGVYCFTDLKLAAGDYIVQVRTLKTDRSRYFDAEQPFKLTLIPPAADPVKRNMVEVKLLPRPAYPFDAQTTLARGRIVKASNGSSIENAQIFLTLDGQDKGLWQRTDERGEFVIFFPRTPPEDDPTAGLKKFKFTLLFKFSGHSHTTPTHEVTEGTTASLEEIKFPGI